MCASVSAVSGDRGSALDGMCRRAKWQAPWGPLKEQLRRRSCVTDCTPAPLQGSPFRTRERGCSFRARRRSLLDRWPGWADGRIDASSAGHHRQLASLAARARRPGLCSALLKAVPSQRGAARVRKSQRPPRRRPPSPPSPPRPQKDGRSTSPCCSTGPHPGCPPPASPRFPGSSISKVQVATGRRINDDNV